MSTLSLRKIKHDSSAVDNITLGSTGRVSIKSSGADGLVLETDSAVSTCSTRIFAKNDTYTGGMYFDNTGWNITTGSTIGADMGSSRLNVTRDGYIRTPSQPIFTGYAPGPHPQTGVVPITAVYLNVGNCWNTTTKQFTCPVDGMYHMHGSFMTDEYAAPSSATGITSVDPQKNGTNIGPRWYLDLNSIGRQVRFSGDTIVQCSVGDTLRFNISAGKIHGDNYNEFFIRFIG